MKVSTYLSQSLNEVENFSNQLFNALVEDNNKINFVNQVVKGQLLTYEAKIQMLSEICDLHLLPTIEARCEATGDVYDIHITLVSSEYIEVIKMSDEKMIKIKFDNLASVNDKLMLLHEMEEYLGK